MVQPNYPKKAKKLYVAVRAAELVEQLASPAGRTAAETALIVVGWDPLEAKNAVQQEVTNLREMRINLEAEVTDDLWSWWRSLTFSQQKSFMSEQEAE